MNKMTNKWPTFNQFIIFLEGKCSIIESSKSNDKVIILKLQICFNFYIAIVLFECYVYKEQHKIFVKSVKHHLIREMWEGDC